MENEPQVGTVKGMISESEARRMAKNLDQLADIIEALNSMAIEPVAKKVFTLRSDALKLKEMF